MWRIPAIVACVLLMTNSYGRAQTPLPAAPAPAVPSSQNSQTPAGKDAGTKQTSHAAAAHANNNGSHGQSPAKAAQPNSQVVRLAPVVVTAARIEQPLSQVGTSVSVVTAATMQEQKIEPVGDALRQVPGVEITQSGSPGTETDASIRGSTAAQTLILVDGVPVNTGSSGGFDLANLTTDNLSQIEVVRGSGGALYGSEAIGGVINILSQEGQGAPKFSLLTEGGNRATQRQTMTANGADGNLHYSGSISYFSTSGFRPINDNSDNLAGALRLDYDLGEDTTLRGFARYMRSNVSLVNYSESDGIALNPNAHQRSEFMLYKGEIDHRFTDHLTASWSGFFVRNEVRLNDYPFPGSDSSESDDIPDESRGSNLQTVYTWAPGTRTLVGFDFLDQWARAGTNYVSPSFSSLTVFHHERQEYAGYVEQEVSLLKGLILATGGFRVDGNSDFGKEVSPAWSIAMPLRRYGTTLRGSYSEGFRAPSFDELFFPGYGNPHLQPELSSEYDGGISQRIGELGSVSVTYFSRRVHNLIVAVPCPSCQYGAEAGNAGRVDVQGVEFEPATTPWHGVQLSGNFTYIDETHRSVSPSAIPIRVPKYAASALLRYAAQQLFDSSDSFTADLVYIFVGDRDDISPMGTIENNVGYQRFDLILTYALDRQWRWLEAEEAFVRIQNLLDRGYAEALGFPAPQVNFVAGFKLDF
jgi:vitamin B12 transporter